MLDKETREKIEKHGGFDQCNHGLLRLSCDECAIDIPAYIRAREPKFIRTVRNEE